MISVLSEWSKRTFSDPELSTLLLTLVFSTVFVVFMGDILAPVFASVIIAYVLEGGVDFLCHKGVPRSLALGIVFLLGVGAFIFFIVGFFPLLWHEVSSFVSALPGLSISFKAWLLTLPERYPEVVSLAFVNQVADLLQTDLAQFGRLFLSVTLDMVPGVLGIVIYMVLVPLLVFFLLKDAPLLLVWFSDYFPKRRRLVNQVWTEVDGQLSRYIRGKLIEIILVSVVTALVFILFDFDYAILLGFLVGVSTLIPYVGAIVVTVPVVILSIVQFGLTPKLGYLLLTYGLIHLLDGQVLVPLLFSEALSLHPLAIFLAILVFGGIGGFWGIFFAIPLATLVKAILNAWPRTLSKELQSSF